MNKDVIYIDVEDDITAIISKLKASKEKIIALVPPKHTGVLQSAVNLRLLARAAKNNDKRVVLITHHASLVNLAAAAAIPVAKNLQSKPELPEVNASEQDDSEDVIDGNEVPVGKNVHDTSANESAALEETIEKLHDTPAPAAASATVHEPRTPKKSRVTVPNFNNFRKKLFFGIAGGIALVAFLVWAIFIAPHATIVIAAKTTSKSINTDVIIGDSLKTDAKKGTMKAIVVSQIDDISQDITATGSKNVGNKAAGTVSLSNQSLGGTTIAAGTRLVSASGLGFVTDSAVTIPASTIGPGCFPVACPGSTTVGVTAEEAGAKYNAASGNLSGAPNSASATFSGPTAGGTDKKVTVITDADVQKAKQTLVDAKTDDIKAELKGKFEGNVATLEDTFTVDYGSVKPSPAVGQEVTGGKASLVGKVTYKMNGVARSEIDDFLKTTLTDSMANASEQRIYESGAAKAQFQDVTKKKVGGEATLVATGRIGPKIDEKAIKQRSVGMKFGDIQADLQSIQGVESVDVQFFPFWISTVPGDAKRITVEFKLNGAN
ncbi:hypothetical protein KBD87_01125 [Candidatus Saccharibacteria bacterium]|nr:hypothetical protein [Candidatus Saccharibacteria bacterium]